jgi:hypothetical protein
MAMAQSTPSAEDRFLAHPARSRTDVEGQQRVNFVEKPSLEAAAMCVSGACQRSKAWPPRLCGEYGRRKGDELCQFPQVLGSGRQ